MRTAYLVLFVTNLVYATSYVATRLVLDDVPSAQLALIRLVIGAAILVPLSRARARSAGPPAGGDAWRIVWMGVFGFAGAFAFTHWGIARSTATNASLLIIVEPLTIMLLGPAVLSERLTRREKIGAAVALLGTIVVVVNGIPGVTHALVPHWRGDLLLALSGIAYASYSLIGRDVLLRRDALDVTARSIIWGVVAMAPLALLEWLGGARPVMTALGTAGAIYLGVVITGLGYLAWNWGLAQVEASRAAVFLTVQPIAGALLGVLFLHEPLTAFTLAGGALVVIGLWLTATGQG